MPHQTPRVPADWPAPAGEVAARFIDAYGPPADASAARMTWSLGRTAGEGTAITVVLSASSASRGPRVSILAPDRDVRKRVVRTLGGQSGEADTLVRAIDRRRVA